MNTVVNIPIIAGGQLSGQPTGYWFADDADDDPGCPKRSSEYERTHIPGRFRMHYKGHLGGVPCRNSSGENRYKRRRMRGRRRTRIAREQEKAG